MSLLSSYPFSSQSTPATCHTWPWLSCTHCMFIWVVRYMAVCSSCTVHTWSCVHWVQIHLAQVDCLPLRQQQQHHLPQTGESAGFTFVSLKNGTSDLTLTLHCITDMCASGACTSAHAFPFPFALPDATSLPSNLVGLNDTDRVARCSSSTRHTSSAFHATSSCYAAASAFHLAHHRWASSIFAMM